MKRRAFSAATLAGCLGGTALVAPPARAQGGDQPVEGTHYVRLTPPAPTGAPGKIEVLEFFWYGCPHCNAFEPRLQAWVKKQPADVAFKRVPVAFRDEFVPQQRLYYALEAMGKVEQLHAKVFEAVHVNHEPTNREDLILAWAGKQGLDTAKFKELYDSFAVSTKARRATQLQDAFKVQGVPAIGVAGRYYTDATLSGSMDRALQVTDYLIAEARKAG